MSGFSIAASESHSPRSLGGGVNVGVMSWNCKVDAMVGGRSGYLDCSRTKISHGTAEGKKIRWIKCRMSREGRGICGLMTTGRGRRISSEI